MKTVNYNYILRRNLFSHDRHHKKQCTEKNHRTLGMQIGQDRIIIFVQLPRFNIPKNKKPTNDERGINDDLFVLNFCTKPK